MEGKKVTCFPSHHQQRRFTYTQWEQNIYTQQVDMLGDGTVEKEGVINLLLQTLA